LSFYRKGTPSWTALKAVVAQSQASVLIYGNPELDPIRVPGAGTAEVQTVEALVKRGWVFAGVIGTDAKGEVKTALNIEFNYA